MADNRKFLARFGLIRAIIGCIAGAAVMAHYLMSVKYWHRYHIYGLITSVTTLGDSISLSGITAVLLMIGLRQVRTKPRHSELFQGNNRRPSCG